MHAGAATVTLVPNADITTGWTVLGGTSDASCSATSTVHCNYVDEGTSNNTADYVSTGTGGTTGETEEYDMTTQSALSATQVQVNVYAESATNANGGTLDTIAVAARINGTLQTATTCSPAFNTYALCTATYNGTYTQSDIDSLRAQIVRTRQGSGSPANQDDDVRIANVYITLTYTAIPNFTQASHRWFNDGTVASGINWSARTPPVSHNWAAVAYGNGTFVAVATSGIGNRAATSSDGITWTSRTTPVDNKWYSVTYGNSLFVAVSYDGTGTQVMTSPDGITWTSRTSAANSLWFSVTYGGGLFVAVACGITSNGACDSSSGTKVMTSSDGITWTGRTSPSNGWSSVTYGGGKFVAVATNGTGNRVMTSPDGITWTSQTSAADNTWRSVTYGNGTFVAVADTGTAADKVMTSPDGITWTSRTAVANTAWESVTYGGGLFVALACGSASTNCDTTAATRVMTSPDGITWTARTASSDSEWVGVAYGNTTFVAVSVSGTDQMMSSSLTASVGSTLAAQDTAATLPQNTYTARLRMNVGVSSDWPTGSGINIKLQYAQLPSGSCDNTLTYNDLGIPVWQTHTTPSAGYVTTAYGGGTYVAVANASGQAMSSTDGITWTARTAATTNTWKSVTYGNGLFVAVSSNGTGNRVMTSPDGITWTSRTSAANNTWNSVTYGNGLFVAVASTGTGNQVMTSSDGITWTSRAESASNTWNAVTYGNGLFVALATTTPNGVMTSPDGITWTSRTSAANKTWNSVTYGNGLFVGVSQSGTGNRVMTSPDGITWTSRTSAADNLWSSVTYGNGLFVAVSSDGTSRIMTSPDGITWTSRTAAASNNWQGVTYGNGLFVAVDAGFTGSDAMAGSTISLGGATSQNLASVVSSGNDPTQGGSTITAQSYQTINSFTNDKSTITAGNYGLWDFPLNFTNTTSSTSYCFRAVKSDGSLLSTYNFWPQITTQTPNNSPAAPTLSTPASSATNVILAPQFTLKTTDVEGDYVRYRITIYQSDCSTVVATADENTSQTGWSGQDASSSTAYAASSSIGGSTMATYTYTGRLATSTTYCWKADAIDPGGSNAFGSATATQSFTTVGGEVDIQGGTTILGGTTVQ